ncbi:permease [Ferruginibacter paludis]|uniref:permease n=1 Tax=Ferruginibacter paludis TaxID=1310417 RepID=UPI0025B4CBA8|nr:permease [Ferruginibacter paludis]MDN3656091.1 permease [Ferruginibacter paludis]
MKGFLEKNKWGLIIFIAFVAFTIASFILNIQAGKDIYKKNFVLFIREMLFFLPFMFILIGLADVWISKDKVEKNIGEGSNIKGTVFVILLSMLQAGPLYSAFPVAYLLWKKGTSVRNIFIYIGAFSTLKLPLLMFEIGFLGWKFSILRSLITLPIIILIALIMERYLKNKNFEINNV